MSGPRTLATVALLASVVALPVSAGLAQGQASPGMAQRCAGLAGQVTGDVRIMAATWHGEGRELPGFMGGPATRLPPHCLVEGMINQRVGVAGVGYGIGFELALPGDYNGRFLLMGGGGLNGSIRPATGPVAAGNRSALERGFAVASHDSGHKGAGFDASFQADQRAALDFAETSVLTVTLASRADRKSVV